MKLKIRVRRFAGMIAAGFALAQGLIFVPSATIAGPLQKTPDSDAPYVLSASTDVSKILLVLENGMEGEQLLKKTKEKLMTLDDRQTRLIASLSDRVGKERNTTGSELAFFIDDRFNCADLTGRSFTETAAERS